MERGQVSFKRAKTEIPFHPGWFCWLVPGLLSIGPCPRDSKDLSFYKDQGITDILNIRPLTDKTTKAGNNKSSPYEWLLKKFDLTMHRRFRLDKDPYPMKKDCVHIFVSLARKIKKEPGKVYFLHYETGLEQEAFLGLLLWKLWSQETFPKNWNDWIANDKNGSLIDDVVIKDVYLKEALEKCSNPQAKFMSQWLQNK